MTVVPTLTEAQGGSPEVVRGRPGIQAILKQYVAEAGSVLAKDQYESTADFQRKQELARAGQHEATNAFYRRASARAYTVIIPTKPRYSADYGFLRFEEEEACLPISDYQRPNFPPILTVYGAPGVSKGRDSDVCMGPDDADLPSFPQKGAFFSYSMPSDQARALDINNASSNAVFEVRLSSNNDRGPAIKIVAVRWEVAGKVVWHWAGEPTSKPVVDPRRCGNCR